MSAATVSRDEESEPAESGFIGTVHRGLVGVTHAHSDLQILKHRIADLEREHPIGEKEFTKAGVRKMTTGINKELAVCQGREESRLDHVHAHMRHGLANPGPTAGQISEKSPVWAVNSPHEKIFPPAKPRWQKT